MRTSGSSLRQLDRVLERMLPPLAWPAPMLKRPPETRPTVPETGSVVVDGANILTECAAEFGFDWGQVRAIEIAQRVPRLTQAFVDARAKEFLTLTLEEDPAVTRLAARYPHARFFVGSLSTFAPLTAGRFDWVSMIDGASGNEALCRALPDLARLLRKKGCLCVRSTELGPVRWNQAAACHERWQLRVLSTRTLKDGTQLILSRRK
ncbi:hypothetical protein K2X85_00115 [bacterium]|nr:hypothetical protein [bacterium]